MVTIDKNYLSSKPDYDWLEKKLEPNFKIVLDDKSKIIFGFNGIGKTSFSRCLKEDSSLNFKFLDYEDENQKFGKDEIRISPYVHQIESISKTIEDDSLSISGTSCSKEQGFKKTSKVYPTFLKTFAKKVTADPASVKKSDSDYLSAISKYPNTKPSILFDVSSFLDKAVNVQNEINSFNSMRLKEMLENVKQFVGNNKTLCPVCGSKVVDIEKIIDSKIAALATIKSDLVAYFEEKGYSYNSNILDEYVDLFSDIKSDSDLLNDYVFCGNDSAKHNTISVVSQRINQNKTSLASLNQTRQTKYNEILQLEPQFKKDVSKYLKISESAISFDNSALEITIKLDRDSSTYSTGERHILWFLVELYSFLGSDSPTLILDDPASSLDIINLYKIAFEIVDKSLKSAGKNIVVFTHSADLINAVNSQVPDRIDIYYLEEYQNHLFCDEINYRPSGSIPNVFDVGKLTSFSPKIAESLKERDYVGYTSPEHPVYHYHPTVKTSQVDNNLTNESLVNRIDSFTGFNKVNFYEDSFNKILYLLSLRVWIEKKLYDLIPVTEQARQNDFLSEENLNKKIKVLENAAKYGIDLLQANGIDRGEIMSRKVMLNQNAHYYSQVMPFAFAINLSLDDLSREIVDIKAIFSE